MLCKLIRKLIISFNNIRPIKYHWKRISEGRCPKKTQFFSGHVNKRGGGTGVGQTPVHKTVINADYVES